MSSSRAYQASVKSRRSQSFQAVVAAGDSDDPEASRWAGGGLEQMYRIKWVGWKTPEGDTVVAESAVHPQLIALFHECEAKGRPFPSYLERVSGSSVTGIGPRETPPPESDLYFMRPGDDTPALGDDLFRIPQVDMTQLLRDSPCANNVKAQQHGEPKGGYRSHSESSEQFFRSLGRLGHIMNEMALSRATFFVHRMIWIKNERTILENCLDKMNRAEVRRVRAAYGMPAADRIRQQERQKLAELLLSCSTPYNLQCPEYLAWQRQYESASK